MAFCWRADDGPTLKAGLVACDFKGIQTSIAKKPYIFVIFQGGSRTPGPTSGSTNVIFMCGILLLRDDIVLGGLYLCVG